MGPFLANIFMADCALSKRFLQPIFNFGIRIYVAFIFFKSGLTKVDENFQVTQSTKDLFANDFKVPYLPSDLAATLASYAELILPVLLVLGLFTRPAALGLFIVNAVAAYTLAQTDFASAIGTWQHIVWGLILATVFVYGPSKTSIDSWFADKWRDRETNLLIKLVNIIVLSAIGYYLLNKYL